MVVSVRTSSAAVVHVFSLEAHPADWEVLEPSSSVLQTDAIPSQLPVHLHVKTFGIDTKKPGVTSAVTPGLPTLLRQYGRVLPASGMPQIKIAWEHIHALQRDLFPATLITFGTQPYGNHDSVSQ